MDNEIEILEYNGEGYNPTMSFGQWRVAIANHAERFDKKKLCRIERHLKTDEVFVLLKGSAVLVVGEELKKYPLEIGKIYNIKQGVWHNILIEKGAKVLIVENNDTGIDNTEYREVIT